MFSEGSRDTKDWNNDCWQFSIENIIKYKTDFFLIAIIFNSITYREKNILISYLKKMVPGMKMSTSNFSLEFQNHKKIIQFCFYQVVL